MREEYQMNSKNNYEMTIHNSIILIAFKNMADLYMKKKII